MLKGLKTMTDKTASIFKPKYYDVGVNITDKMFTGEYHGRKHHESDILKVLAKSYRHHVTDILLTGSSLDESKNTIDIIKSLKHQTSIPLTELPNLYSTVGVHPCTVLEFENEDNPNIEATAIDHLQKLEAVINEGLDLNVVKAFGEIGLDYDRLHYTPADKQKLYFEKQLNLATKFDLPLFLHMRAACDDFVSIIKPFIDNNKLKNKNLLVHSFTGDRSELEKLLSLESSQSNTGNYKVFISLNGASLRDESTLNTISSIPLNRLMIETDSPWCEIKKTHPSYKYLTKSPNPFYPEEYENYELITKDSKIQDLITSSTTNKKKGNNNKVNLFEFLPIPIVKSEKFDQFEYNDLFEDSPLIKARNEPCLIGLVAQVVSKVTDTDPQTLIEHCYNNSKEVFG